jgi:hypothetical protein
MRTPLSVAWLASALFVLGCSSSDAADAPGAPVECNPPGFPNDPAELDTQVTATLVDPSGAVAAEVRTQMCGVNLCDTSTSDASGRVSMTSSRPLVQPAFKYGDGFDFAELAVRLNDAGEHDLGELVVVPLPGYVDGAVFPKSGGQVTNGDLTLKLEPGTVIELDTLTYGAESDRTFRTAPIPVDASKQALPEEFGFELAYGISPINTHFCPAAALSLPNSLSWEAGTEVEVFVQGLETGSVDIGPGFAPYGAWTKVADAQVSKDGSTISTTEGGIPVLSSIALRRK